MCTVPDEMGKEGMIHGHQDRIGGIAVRADADGPE
jgi:hypothetical protein